MDSVHSPQLTGELFLQPQELSRAAARPVDELERLYHQHSRYVAAIALRLLGSNDAVDDVVQDVFMIAMRRIETLRDPRAVRGWLATTTVRLASRKLRRRKLREVLWTTRRAPELPVYVEANAEQRVLLAQAYRVLDRLPVDVRVAWLLRHVEDVRLEDVAVWCGCSLATIKRRVATAQAALERELR